MLSSSTFLRVPSCAAMQRYASSMLIVALLASVLQLLPPPGCGAISSDQLSASATVTAGARAVERATALKQHDASLRIPPEYHPDVSTVVQLSWKPRSVGRVCSHAFMQSRSHALSRFVALMHSCTDELISDSPVLTH